MDDFFLDPTSDVRLAELPTYKSELCIFGGFTDGLRVRFCKKKPNIWWRFWHWMLLGWKWKDIEDD